MMIPPDPGSSLPAYLSALGETLSIALLGTTTRRRCGAAGQPAGGAEHHSLGWLRFPVRRFFDSIRGVDTLIWALVWINVVGLGPFAGVLAIAAVRLRRVRQAVFRGDRGCRQEAGRRHQGFRRQSRCTTIRFGLLPQVLPVIAGQVLYFIESNTRSATIIGIVGAGGIGLQLAEQIRVLEWQQGFVPDPDDFGRGRRRSTGFRASCALPSSGQRAIA